MDFCCLQKKLIIEVDDKGHLDPSVDKVRTAFLIDKGFRILRFWNGEVRNDTENVLSKIATGLGDTYSLSGIAGEGGRDTSSDRGEGDNEGGIIKS